MEPISIATTCIGLLTGIAALSKHIGQFVILARDARKDIGGFQRELSSLSLCIHTLHDDELKLPDSLRDQLLVVLKNCDDITKDMTRLIGKDRPIGVGKRIQWTFQDRDEVVRLRERLESHKSTVEITLEAANIIVNTTIKDDTAAIRSEVAALRFQVLQLTSTGHGPKPMLQRYLAETMSSTESVVDASETLQTDAAEVVSVSNPFSDGKAAIEEEEECSNGWAEDHEEERSESNYSADQEDTASEGTEHVQDTVYVDGFRHRGQPSDALSNTPSAHGNNQYHIADDFVAEMMAIGRETEESIVGSRTASTRSPPAENPIEYSVSLPEVAPFVPIQGDSQASKTVHFAPGALAAPQAVLSRNLSWPMLSNLDDELEKSVQSREDETQKHNSMLNLL